MVSHPGVWHFITFFPSFISRSVIVIPHVHALSCKSRAFLIRRCRVLVLELPLGLPGVSAFVFEGGSEVVARAMVGAAVTAGGDGAAVVFVRVEVTIVTEAWASALLTGASDVAAIVLESRVECWVPVDVVAGAAATRDAWTWAWVEVSACIPETSASVIVEVIAMAVVGSGAIVLDVLEGGRVGDGGRAVGGIKHGLSKICNK